MNAPAIKLFLFHRDLRSSVECLEAGVNAIIIDLEHRGKASRQSGYDTQINTHTTEQLASVKAAAPGAHLICRIGGPEEADDAIDEVLDAGASELVVPMITTLAQANRMARLAHGRCALTLMVETPAAVAVVEDLARLPATRIYVGLNDLHIARAGRSLFDPLIDDTLNRVRAAVKAPEFGFGGLTLPDRGAPLEAKHLYAEMARLKTDFTFLRRSFYRDSEHSGPAHALSEIRNAFKVFRQRSLEDVARDRDAAFRAVEALRLAAAC